MLEIEIDLKGYELRNRLNQLKFENREYKILDILIELTKENLMSLTPFDNIQISKEDVRTINILDITDNTELIARWYDLLQSFKVDVQCNCFLAYDNYIKAYSQTKKWVYALRAFLIVKLKKGIFKNRLIEIEMDCRCVLTELQYSKPYSIITSTIVSVAMSNTFISDLEKDIYNKLDNCIINNSYNDALSYVDSLELIGKLNNEECRRKRSSILEQQADNIIANKEPNTHYPNIVNLFHKALKEISSLKDCESDKQRLSDKLIKEQENSVKAMQLIGEITAQKIDFKTRYEQIAFEYNIDNALSAYRAMISFPIISKKYVAQQREDSKVKHQFLHESFGRHVWCNEKGATTNIKDGDDAINDSVRSICHSVMIEYLKIFMMIIHSSDDGDIDIDEKFIYEHLRNINSKFIPQDRIHLYVQGLYFGFKGDYSLASHILLPQMENSFRHIAQQHNIITTRLSEEIQNENTMGGVLAKLKQHTDPDLWSELNYFLLDGVGFRNQVMHGLLSHEQMFHYGIYLCWLCLKIIHNTDRYFKFNKTS